MGFYLNKVLYLGVFCYYTMLIVCGNQIKSNDVSLQNYHLFKQRYGQEFLEGAKSLQSKSLIHIQPSDCCLYVSQREFAAISPDDEGVHDVLANYKRFKSKEHRKGEEENITLHLVGGFLDNDSSSISLTEELLTGFAYYCDEFDIKITLETFACTSLNTRTLEKNGFTINSPIIFGVSMSVETGEIVHAQFVSAARSLFIDLRGAYCLFGGLHLRSLYNSEEKCVEILPFTLENINIDVRLILRNSDEWILEHLSTSPEVEPEEFVPNMRETLKFVLDNPEPIKNIFVNNRPLKYKLNKSALWMPV